MVAMLSLCVGAVVQGGVWLRVGQYDVLGSEELLEESPSVTSLFSSWGAGGGEEGGREGGGKGEVRTRHPRRRSWFVAHAREKCVNQHREGI